MNLKTLLPPILAAIMLAGCGKPPPPGVDLWKAAAEGNVEVVRQHIAAGTDLNGKEPAGKSTPLIVASLFGQTEAARALIKGGAKLEIKNKDGATALQVAAFFCQPEMVKLLLASGADAHAKNKDGLTPLDTVAAAWSPEVEGIYRAIFQALNLPLDVDRIKQTRPEIARLLRERTGR